MTVMMHIGGASIPGSDAIGAEHAIKVQPDVASHLNGGPTAPSLTDIERIICETDAALEIIQCGNVAIIPRIIELARRHDALQRVIIGTDMPSGSGVIPLGILRTIAWVSALCDIAPERAIAMAAGSTAAIYNLPAGRIAPGLEADLVIMDAPIGSVCGRCARDHQNRRYSGHLRCHHRWRTRPAQEPQYAAGNSTTGAGLMKRFEGKVVLVTGAGGALGRASALRFAQEGARVVVADVDEERACTVAAEIGDAAVAIVADVTQADDCAAMAQLAQDAYGGLDVVFANAGIGGGKLEFVDMPDGRLGPHDGGQFARHDADLQGGGSRADRRRGAAQSC